MAKALEDIKVLELSHYIAGPMAGQLLADLGADVYKVEKDGYGKGDIARLYDPSYKDMSLYFCSYNRNKKFITLDIKTEKGREIFKELVTKVDVVIDNYRPGVMDKLGIGYEELSKINPGIIMTEISGFGQNGPYRDKMALDMSMQAVSGFMDFTGFPDGAPTKGGPVLSDFIAGIYASYATTAAIYHKEKTGKGQHIDIALLDCMFTLLENFPSIYYMSGEVPKRSGNGRPFSAPTGTYKTKDDRWVHLSATSESLFERLAKVIDREDLIGDPRMASAAVRKKNESAIEPPIIEWVASKTLDEVVDVLEKSGIPNGPVRTIEEVIKDPQLKYRNMLVSFPDSITENLPFIANPVKMSETPVVYNNAAKEQGSDNMEVYNQLLGYSEEHIRKLIEEKII